MSSDGGSLWKSLLVECNDSHLYMHNLHRMEQSVAQECLVGTLDRMSDDDFDYYLMQLCQLALVRFSKSDLHWRLVERASRSTYFTMKLSWLLQCIAAQAGQCGGLEESAIIMLGTIRQATRTTYEKLSAGTSAPSSCGRGSSSPNRDFDSIEHSIDVESMSTAQLRTVADHLTKLVEGITPLEKAIACGCKRPQINAYLKLGTPLLALATNEASDDNLTGASDFFRRQDKLMQLLVGIHAELLTTADKLERDLLLANALKLLNHWMFERRMVACFGTELDTGLGGLLLPMSLLGSCRRTILRIQVPLCRVLSSASRAPFLLVYETVALELDEFDALLSKRDDRNEDDGIELSAYNRCRPPNGNVVSFDNYLPISEFRTECILRELLAVGCIGDTYKEGDRLVPPSTKASHENVTHFSCDAMLRIRPEIWKRLAVGDFSRSETPRIEIYRPCSTCPNSAAWSDIENVICSTDEKSLACLPARCVHCPLRKRAAAAQKLRRSWWGESWQETTAKIRQSSPFGSFRSWALEAVIVKADDDLRQELLAAQFITELRRLFKAVDIRLWLQEISILVTGETSGVVECIHDAVSIDNLKKKAKGKSLGAIFKTAFADRLLQARRNFVESCAGYSLVTWFLQVKDRHNANLLIDASGHLVHIDFGFMLSNSPGGNFCFEQAPFKLTQEFLDVMGGHCSDQYEYFRTLFICGFLEARRHMERLLLPVRILASYGSKLPCFREGSDSLMQSMQDRFFHNLSEKACVDKVVELIDCAANNWRTEQYDNYQRLVNGIL